MQQVRLKEGPSRAQSGIVAEAPDRDGVAVPDRLQRAQSTLLRRPTGASAHGVVAGIVLAVPRVQPPPLRTARQRPTRGGRKRLSRCGTGRLGRSGSGVFLRNRGNRRGDGLAGPPRLVGTVGPADAPSTPSHAPCIPPVKVRTSSNTLGNCPWSPATLAYTVLLLSSIVHAASAACPEGFPEDPVIERHIEQQDIAAGLYSFQEILDYGRALFVAKFNTCDGRGRPTTTGTGDKRVSPGPDFIRTSAPDANSCAGCHNEPTLGGSGDVVANVFVLAQAMDPVTLSIDPSVSNERNTLGIFGAGAIEMLAREMTAELQGQADGLSDGKHTLRSKGVAFEIVIEDGALVAAGGIDTDLVVKPFHQAGVVVSLREFTVNAMNHHHGMQAEERFDLNPATGFDPDFDQDEHRRELTVGDISAATLFQAALGVPQQIVPADTGQRFAVERGEWLFDIIGCALCHIPEMVLNGRRYVEPNPMNPPGTWSDSDLSYSFDMTREGMGPRLEADPAGGAVVRAYTDLKRHNLCDPENKPGAIRFFCNEQLDQGRPSQGGRPGREYFLTRKLWDVGSSAPYGHRGDITTITEAILHHGGEGRLSRDNFAQLPGHYQRAVVDFLKTLRVPD